MLSEHVIVPVKFYLILTACFERYCIFFACMKYGGFVPDRSFNILQTQTSSSSCHVGELYLSTKRPYRRSVIFRCYSPPPESVSFFDIFRGWS